MLQAIKLSKRYEDGVLALDGLNLNVDAGEIYCLLGANGAGKTTTINLFLNFIEPTTGQALINGIDVNKEPLAAKQYVAYVPEHVRLYGNFTARQNLEFFARLAGKGPGREELYQRLEEVGLEGKAFEQRVRSFSKGMRQKVGLAVAIVRDAPALLLDEPTSGLDPHAAAEVVEILTTFAGRGKAILMSTHDIFRAKEITHRVGIMKEGKVVMECSRDELGNENLEQLYLQYIRDDAEAGASPDSGCPGSHSPARGS